MGRPRAAQATILSVHTRLITDRGRAREYVCVGCPRRALDWAYQHTGQVLIDCRTGRKYSVDPGDYAPMCRSCHFKMDAPRDPEWVESNRRNGEAGKERKKTVPMTAKQLAVLEACRKKVNVKSRRCVSCGLESTPAGMAIHLKSSSHGEYEEIL